MARHILVKLINRIQFFYFFIRLIFYYHCHPLIDGFSLISTFNITEGRKRLTVVRGRIAPNASHKKRLSPQYIFILRTAIYPRQESLLYLGLVLSRIWTFLQCHQPVWLQFVSRRTRSRKREATAHNPTWPNCPV